MVSIVIFPLARHKRSSKSSRNMNSGILKANNTTNFSCVLIFLSNHFINKFLNWKYRMHISLICITIFGVMWSVEFSNFTSTILTNIRDIGSIFLIIRLLFYIQCLPATRPTKLNSWSWELQMFWIYVNSSKILLINKRYLNIFSADLQLRKTKINLFTHFS